MGESQKPTNTAVDSPTLQCGLCHAVRPSGGPYTELSVSLSLLVEK